MKLEELLALDRRASEKMRLKPEKRGLWFLAAFFAHSGDSWWWLAFLLVVWLVIKGTWHRVSALLAVGILILALLILAFKWVFRRRRPKGEWGKIYRLTDPHSFPSGHAARAFAIAVMSFSLCPLWLSIILLIWAPIVSIARVVMGVHYLSDVIAGTFIGIIWGIVMLFISPAMINGFPWLFGS